MAASGIPQHPGRRRMTAAHTVAIVIATVSGSYALVALLFGSPLEFGLALALCAVCWIVAHFIERTVERDRAAYTRAALAARFSPGYGHACSRHPGFELARK